MSPQTHNPAPSTTSIGWLRATTALALVSGAALLVDTVTIAVINRSFDPLDSVLFLTGFVGMLLTVAALSVYLTRSRRGVNRAFVAVGFYAVGALVLGLIALVFDEFGRHTFNPSNRGLHGEWSFFSIGVTMILLGAWAQHRQSQPS